MSCSKHGMMEYFQFINYEKKKKKAVAHAKSLESIH